MSDVEMANDQDKTLKPTGEDAPQIVEHLLRQAEAFRASDIHLQMRGPTAEVAYRLDGVLTPADALPAEVADRVFGRIKFLARLKTYQDYLPQDGRIDKADVHASADVRVATYPTVTGEKIVLRLFQAEAARTLAELELPPEVRQELQGFLARNSGLLLLTGPAGSGKTTTIYACLRALAENRQRHIITVEDPVEQVIPGVMQTEVNDARGLSFATAARHLLRQDPQVLVIGEIRDEETANIVVRAALTGHLVISTLHAGSCRGVFERLLVLCKEHSAVASCVELVLNQRLVRRFCSRCSGTGCSACLNTGYSGRMPVIELLRVTPPLRSRISHRELDAIRPEPTMLTRCRELAAKGLTSEGEINRVLGRTEDKAKGWSEEPV